MKPGESEEVTDKMNDMREENNKLYFELKNGYGQEADTLKKQKDYLR